jgi:hypothetical protein
MTISTTDCRNHRSKVFLTLGLENSGNPAKKFKPPTLEILLLLLPTCITEAQNLEEVVIITVEAKFPTRAFFRFGPHGEPKSDILPSAPHG